MALWRRRQTLNEALEIVEVHRDQWGISAVELSDGRTVEWPSEWADNEPAEGSYMVVKGPMGPGWYPKEWWEAECEQVDGRALRVADIQTDALAQGRLSLRLVDDQVVEVELVGDAARKFVKLAPYLRFLS